MLMPWCFSTRPSAAIMLTNSLLFIRVFLVLSGLTTRYHTNKTYKNIHIHKYCHNGACHLVATAGTTIPVPCHFVKSLQLLWRSGTHRWNLKMPNYQMNCRLDFMKGYQDGSPSNGHQGDMPYCGGSTSIGIYCDCELNNSLWKYLSDMFMSSAESHI